jgi:hypothetical protein
MHYFWQRLIKDIFILVPVYIGAFTSIQNSDLYSWILLVMFLKHTELKLINKRMLESFYLNRTFEHIIDIAHLLFLIVFFSHMFACVWIFMARVEE